jgi:hypothetical protein
MLVIHHQGIDRVNLISNLQGKDSVFLLTEKFVLQSLLAWHWKVSGRECMYYNVHNKKPLLHPKVTKNHMPVVTNRQHIKL